MDALKRLLADREECCVFYHLVVGEEGPSTLEQLDLPPDSTFSAPDGLNESQLLAMRSWRSPLSLIWGPPGMKYLITLYTLCLTSPLRIRYRKDHGYGPNSL